ncbi:hypothetical protein CPB83DRAFT_833323 [Crepidotus variabilis]|uniref:Uncharacterized protein n=1 Tax=Crepidotus variabilis TaxID=179855 RepID=A0A9P6EM39_9AGAR|nr:hypothetical protein CPB83DRAFT_833323 [Crepidotus variabilis]
MCITSRLRTLETQHCGHGHAHLIFGFALVVRVEHNIERLAKFVTQASWMLWKNWWTMHNRGLTNTKTALPEVLNWEGEKEQSQGSADNVFGLNAVQAKLRVKQNLRFCGMFQHLFLQNATAGPSQSNLPNIPKAEGDDDSDDESDNMGDSSRRDANSGSESTNDGSDDTSSISWTAKPSPIYDATAPSLAEPPAIASHRVRFTTVTILGLSKLTNFHQVRAAPEGKLSDPRSLRLSIDFRPSNIVMDDKAKGTVTINLDFYFIYVKEINSGKTITLTTVTGFLTLPSGRTKPGVGSGSAIKLILDTLDYEYGRQFFFPQEGIDRPMFLL